MGALTGASPERAQIAGSGWQDYGENGIYECTFRDIENSATGGKNEYFFNFGIILFTLMKD